MFLKCFGKSKFNQIYAAALIEFLNQQYHIQT